MILPFTVEQFFAVFARYNQEVWPAQLLLYALAVVSVCLALRKKSNASVLVSSVLAGFWLWMGAVYHLAYFLAINPAAFGFGVLFIVQALVFVEAGVIHQRLQFRFRPDARGLVGAALLAYALIVYPLLGWLAGHRYPAAPTFGLPCPTTIFTFGLLLWAVEQLPWRVLVIPLLWALIGSFAALFLTVIEDFGLPIAGLIVVSFMALRRRTELLWRH
jgi:hypothetical protein